MNENKQNNPDIKQVSDGTDKKIHRDVLKWIIIGLAAFVILILIFGVGMFVGGMKAKFSYRWAESYHKNFAGPRGGFFGDWRMPLPPPGDFIEGHGTFGEIIQINDFDFVIKGKGDLEKIIVIKENTILEKGRTTIKKDDLKVGDQVVVIGSPNEQGQIEAKLIRIFNGEDIKNPPSFPRLPFFR
ncbi:MAG: hypothetical protein CO031_00335 [Candidatus Nealsonbacteria bacterium CG_4_9_14_0_2_um_filter_37_38]|uniref:Uncharacterized protein n=1 Tax=Candidatus Nealsonbacteria bacterium CG_4_10_14_0_8_um_filter_37_14 TaxID=1974684 RepID=A0A2M7R7X8_9BACT|nr:MAG: hypothetical protein COV63_02540 [Candidatus Nealsonbacteria bacterium CG11_big_fil_rev_8_21_14_0_20_37_68]PIW92302.1 MAG: hypothetical protein COZ89_00640 [Candidatus Nealsonbacteria bacterium CG_4_8_14_3_um_filter_37_23]PIY89629.1 MAG: hypothetical protein COY73_00415 [Candidatus Nealsonbacteria bacterium CG_4_10_14_0_8_um_filter_37_14]PJC51878.1 MAG: hypothetical protein CO031_00335 [Candidatus Nealsonbacteria bacterium CG_4_9_14_0_2_um_filter_37_38]